jgi:lysophospholipase L1-like esterase
MVMRFPSIPRLLVAPLMLLGLALLFFAGCATSETHSVTTTTATHQFTYVVIGASDAYGIGTNNPAKQSWPSVVAAQLGGTVHLVNLGIPGETVADAKITEIPIALDSAPDVITVWLAVNDLEAKVPLATYAAQLQKLLTTLKSNTSAAIFVGNLPDLTLLHFFANMDQTALRQTVLQWNVAIASVCAATGVHLVDLFADWADLAHHPEYISSDGLHPSVLGAQKLAAIFATAIHDAGVR